MADFRDIELIGSTIRNGRIYFSASDASFFPTNSFGDRASNGSKGIDVEFRAGTEIIRTDIRYLSEVRIGPRASFSAFLKSQRAEVGSTLRVSKVADRKYRIDYLG